MESSFVASFGTSFLRAGRRLQQLGGALGRVGLCAGDERRQRKPDRAPGKPSGTGLEPQSLFLADEEQFDVGGGVGSVADRRDERRTQPPARHMRRDHVVDVGVWLDRQRRERGGDFRFPRARDRGDRQLPLTGFGLRGTGRVEHDLRIELEAVVSERHEVDPLRRDGVPVRLRLLVLIA